MATPAQISRLARIEQLANRVRPGVEGCVICIPDAWLDTPLEAQTLERHCQRYPEDATAKIVVRLRLFGPRPVSSPVEPGEPLAVNSTGWRACDSVSWQGWAP
jgi:hypothetical protein